MLAGCCSVVISISMSDNSLLFADPLELKSAFFCVPSRCSLEVIWQHVFLLVWMIAC